MQSFFFENLQQYHIGYEALCLCAFSSLLSIQLFFLSHYGSHNRVITFFKKNVIAFSKGVITVVLKGVTTPFGKTLLCHLENRYYAFQKGVITPFGNALLCHLERLYFAFWKGVIRLGGMCRSWIRLCWSVFRVNAP